MSSLSRINLFPGETITNSCCQEAHGRPPNARARKKVVLEFCRRFRKICQSLRKGMLIIMKPKAKYGVIGALGGLANGFFGSGGGLFLVPLFTGWVKLPQRKSFATSVAVILPLSAVSAVIYWFKGALDISAAWPFLIGGAVGGALSGLVFKKIPLTWLRRAFGLLILYCGVRAVLAL